MDIQAGQEVSASDLFEQMIEATTMKNVLTLHNAILMQADLTPCEFNVFFPRFKRAVTSNRQKKNWKAKALFSKIEKRAGHRCYSNTKLPNQIGDKTKDINQTANQENSRVLEDNSPTKSISKCYNNNHALQDYNCLIIGSGPAGLRTAVELQLLGASRVIVVEKRGRFSRNNVLHLWPFVIDDLKSLGAKKFYGKFCAGSIDHISIRQLQLILLKVCLMIGCDFRESCSYTNLCPRTIKQPFESLPACETCDKKNNLVQGKCDQELDFQAGSGCETLIQRADNMIEPSMAIISHGESQAIKPEEKQKTSKKLQLAGAKAHFECESKSCERELELIDWDIIVGADGRRNTLSSFFPRREFRGRLAIAITANFINRQTPAETSVPEISGISYIYNQDMFNALAYDTNIELENICYYKDDTHYFVMTAKKRSLLERGVLIRDYPATLDLLDDSNVNKTALLKYAKDAARWTTGLEPLDFALNHYGQEDCAMFDFTSMYAASNACKALRTVSGGFTLVSLVGDSLLEPFWPTGSGCARGFLSSLDAAWMCRQWAVNRCAVIDHHGPIQARSTRSRLNNSLDCERKLSPSTTYDKMALSVIAERESIYRILAQTTSENLQQNYSLWTLNPHTRYPNLNRHLISPAQVEHLIVCSQKGGQNGVDEKFACTKSEHLTRRVKSPIYAKSRRSPKKLKSAGASPLMQPKNGRNQSKYALKSRSRFDMQTDEDYLEFEESYRNLVDTEHTGRSQYLNYKQSNSMDLNDLLSPSISGTLPSSNNLSKLEARKARDIDECLRQRRQKEKISMVRDQLISRMSGKGSQRDLKGAIGPALFPGGNAALFNEIRRMRDQQSRGLRSENKMRDIVREPLSLLSSMQRCASFAERVKSFENKLSNQDSVDSSAATTPKTPIDNVKNLPQFATLQELIVNSTQNSVSDIKKTRGHVTKLSKDDWNVKFWEERLATNQQKCLSVSSKSLNRGLSLDSGTTPIQNFLNKPKKQVDVFQSRVKEMANKLKIDKENGAPHPSNQRTLKNLSKLQLPATVSANSVRSQTWVNHLKKELARGNQKSGRVSLNGQVMNPVMPSKPIKKLFDDDDQDKDDGIDINKHYDHLCINRPKNKYLSKGAYTSHLARVNYNSSNCKVINSATPTLESKQAYMAAIASRGSSASSTVSDYSTNTANSSSTSGSKQNYSGSSVIDVECFRCKKFVTASERITMGTSSLHRACLSCSGCGVTLRSNELQHYLHITVRTQSQAQDGQVRYLCAICKPDLGLDFFADTDPRTTETSLGSPSQLDVVGKAEVQESNMQLKLRSREEFLNSSINYSELYKNIINADQAKPKAVNTSREPQSSHNGVEKAVGSIRTESSQKIRADDVEAKNTLDVERPAFSVAEVTTTDDGSEQVTLVLTDPEVDLQPSRAHVEARAGEPPESVRRPSKDSEMIDEEELERILYLDTRRRLDCKSANDRSSSDSNTTDEEEITTQDEDSCASPGDNSLDGIHSGTKVKPTKDVEEVSRRLAGPASVYMGTADENSSSLELPPDSEPGSDTDAEDEEATNNELRSTCEDFVTSEEFDPPSEKEEEATLSEGVSCARDESTNGVTNLSRATSAESPVV